MTVPSDGPGTHRLGNRGRRAPSISVCSEPGCPELTDRGRCARHRREAERNRPTPAARGYDATWRRTRGRYLKHHPTCEEPGCTADSGEVHHLDGLGPNGPAGHKWANLEALCKPHHAKRTAREQPGGWNAR